jgi:hypothetical protein
MRPVPRRFPPLPVPAPSAAVERSVQDISITRWARSRQQLLAGPDARTGPYPIHMAKGHVSVAARIAGIDPPARMNRPAQGFHLAPGGSAQCDQ